LRELAADRSRTIVIIEHKLDGCVDIVDRVVVLHPDGGVVVDGPPRVVFQEHAERLDALGIWQPAAPRLARRLQPHGRRIEQFPLTADEAAPALTRAGVGAEDVLRVEPPASAPAPSSEMPALEIRDLSFAYGKQQVLASLDLTVPNGAILALLGPNGAGK